MRYVGDVEATRSNVAGGEDRDVARAEFVECFCAAFLVHVTMQGSGVEPVFHERFV